MHPTLCTRCKKNVAVIFITKIENNEAKNKAFQRTAKNNGIDIAQKNDATQNPHR